MRSLRPAFMFPAVVALVLGMIGSVLAAPPFVEDDAEALLVLTGDAAGDYFGWVAANIGDTNGDGVPEVLIPAILDGSGGVVAGKATLFSPVDGTALASHTGMAFELFGYSSSGAGDVDGDGVPDYVIGAPGLSGAVPPSGRVIVYSGADHTVLHEFTPTDDGFFGSAFFGSGVGAAGDVNGDGHDDVIVGAARADDPGEDAGQAYVYSGSDGSLLWHFDGRHAGDWAGAAVGGLGDVNADGVPDVVVGAQGNGGQAFVLSGHDGALIHHFRPRPGTGSAFGQFFASGPGDVDGDGVPDVFIADYNAGRGANLGTGIAYVFSGATGAVIHELRAEAIGDGFGPGRGVGDVNDDGHADLIIAGYTSSAGAPFAGKAYVISGADGSVLRTITSTIANENFGVDALGIGDTNGDGLTDFVVTAVGLSFAGTHPGTVYIVAGTELS